MSANSKDRGRKARIDKARAAQDARQVELLPDFAPEAAPDRVEDSEPPSHGGEPRETKTEAWPVDSVGDHVPGTEAPRQPPAPRPQGNQLARARELVEAGRIEDAIAQYHLVLAENPANVKAHNNLGVLFDELGQQTTALEHFEHAERADPDNVEVLANYGRALTALARFEEADGALKKALRLAPEDLPARLAMGILSFRKGLYAQAEAELRWVCERDSDNGPAFYYRAEALNRISRFDEAAEIMEQAAELMPEDPRPFYTLGHLYDRQRRPDEAADMYHRARDLQAT